MDSKAQKSIDKLKKDFDLTGVIVIGSRGEKDCMVTVDGDGLELVTSLASAIADEDFNKLHKAALVLHMMKKDPVKALKTVLGELDDD